MCEHPKSKPANPIPFPQSEHKRLLFGNELLESITNNLRGSLGGALLVVLVVDVGDTEAGDVALGPLEVAIS